MIRPVNFAFNAQTAANNAFQSTQDRDAQELALKEFNDFVVKLRGVGIDVTVLDDTPVPHTPDSIFPNNWISFHEGGEIFLYPMFAENRRMERKQHVLENLKNKFTFSTITDLSSYESKNQFLEGTGSMVLDRQNRIAYACISERTNSDVLNDFCAKAGFHAVPFTATDQNKFPIYHTNVMMCIADAYAVICMESIADAADRKKVTESLESTKKEIILISLEQMNQFAGNMLQVKNASGEKFLIMSSQAFRSLTPTQIEVIEKHDTIIHSELSTIERNGGGSARCMMAEIFLEEL